MKSTDGYWLYAHISPSNKIYFGITKQKNPEHRWSKGKGYSGNDYFTKAINKYGWNNFQHVILDKGLKEEYAKVLEIFYIGLFNTTDRRYGYNITKGGEGGNGYHHTEETKHNISNKLKGVNTWTSSALKGRKRPPMTQEIKDKISNSKKGQSHPATEYQKKRISETHSKPVLVYKTEDGSFYMRFNSRKECAKHFNISETTVGDCIAGRTKTFNKKKYIAKYEEK